MKEILDKCYQEAVEILKANREDMDKVVAYLLEKETITGAEMVAIIEGRDPELVEDAYASTRSDAARPAEIEAPARKVHMISQKISAPEAPADGSDPEQSPQAEDAPADTVPGTPEQPGGPEDVPPAEENK